MSDRPHFDPSTLVIHSNRSYEKQSNSILFPIHQTATYIHESVGGTKGYGYSRGANPTVNALEQAIAAIEGTDQALCFRSGMSAITTLCLSILKAGDRAPSFTLTDPEGQPVSSDTLLERGPLVISFYRGVWCPYCNMELQALQEALPRFENLGAQLVAISPQTAANSRKSVRQNALGFPILSDPHNAVAAAFGLRFALPDYLVDLYRSLKNDLPAFNGDPSWTLPMPGRFVVGPDGVILYAEVNPDYTRRPEPEAMLPALRRAASVPA